MRPRFVLILGVSCAILLGCHYASHKPSPEEAKAAIQAGLPRDVLFDATDVSISPVSRAADQYDYCANISLSYDNTTQRLSNAHIPIRLTTEGRCVANVDALALMVSESRAFKRMGDSLKNGDAKRRVESWRR